MTAAHAETVEAFLAAERIDPADIAIVGFHGQTVLHKPAARLTVQIGDGAALGAPHRTAGGLRLPRRRRRRRRAGRAAGAGVPSGAGARARARAPDRGAQCRAASPISPSSTGAIRSPATPGRATRCSTISCARAPAPARPRRRRGGARPRARGFHRARAGAGVLRAAVPEIARPQCLRLRQYRACRISPWPTARRRWPR